MIIRRLTSAKGNNVIIRHATAADAEPLLALMHTILQSYPEFVLTKPEELTLTVKQEKDWIKNLNANETGFLALAEVNSNLAGMLNFETHKKKKVSHSGEFAIGIHPDYLEEKIGTVLLECFLDWARQQPKIEKVILNVNETNSRAVHLYKKYGFVTEGRNLKALKLADGSHLNNLQMALFVR